MMSGDWATDPKCQFGYEVFQSDWQEAYSYIKVTYIERHWLAALASSLVFPHECSLQQADSNLDPEKQCTTAWSSMRARYVDC